MDVDFLESFVVVAELKSFSKAAEFLHITQPTITARIQSLEKELGAPLFYRKGREFSLTDYGEIFLTYAKSGLEQIKEGALLVRKKVEEEKDEVRIGATNPFAMSLLPHLVPVIYKNFQDVRLTVLRMGYSEEVFQMVKRGEIEIGFVNEIIALEQVESEHLFADPIVLLSHPDHPLAKKGQVALVSLENVPILYLNSKASYWKKILDYMEGLGIQLQNKIEINNVDVIKNMVMGDRKAVTLLPKVLIQSEVSGGQMCIVPVSPELPDLSVSMIYKSRRNSSELLRYIADCVKKKYREMC